MHASHIGTFDYVICTRNRRHTNPNAEGPEEHGSAFLIGKVLDVVPSTDPEWIAEAKRGGKRRYLIRMAEAATIDLPKFWQWGHWPTHYDELDKLGIDLTSIDFKPLSNLLAERRNDTEVSSGSPACSGPLQRSRDGWRDLISDAKVSLGPNSACPQNRIEITVRI